ncbi:hypothetical protein CK203_008598 [Vitis vinifera]|uniref:Uncharacterized protein n=1 Tax=Vitis vinifera TaxID=29760 RepID=A0A438KDG9_VITVI|nr:hypothetical protein CK203_008598 [Vitis vinifera]
MDSSGVSKGGKCWFAVESKAFEISIEVVRGKLRGTILERSKGFSSCIRFGEKSLSLLLEGVEAWCRGESNLRRLKRCRRKEVLSSFSRRKWLSGGLAKKLRALGVSFPVVRNSFQCDSSVGKVESSVNALENESSSYAEVVKGKTGESGDSLRVHLGEREMMCREEQLGRCLVGCFGGSPKSIPPLPSLKRWAYERSRRFKDRDFLLQRWGPEVGCTWKESFAKEVWVRVVGLPLHLWSREVFKSIGECCGGFVAVDEETTFFSQLQWARILVNVTGKKWSGLLQVEAGNFRWELCLWWEALPRDEGGGVSHAEARVREPQVEIQKRGSDVKVACGSGRRTTEGVRGRTAEIHAVGSSAEGLYSLSPKVLGRGKEPEEPNGPFKTEAHLGPLREPVPSKAPFKSVEIFAALEQELLAVGNAGGKVSSLDRLKPTDEALLDEASRYPLHRKLPIFSLGFGVSSPSTPFLGLDGVVMGKVGVSSGMLGAVEGARKRDSLREERLEVFSTHEGGNLSPRVMGGDASGSELAIVPFGVGLESPLAETLALQVEEGDERKDGVPTASRSSVTVWECRQLGLRRKFYSF